MTDKATPTDDTESEHSGSTHPGEDTGSPAAPGAAGHSGDPAVAEESDVPEEPGEPEERPLSPLAAFAEKNRFALGLAIAVVMVAVGAWAALTFVPPTPIPGAFGVIQRYAFPAMCALIAVVGTTWALRAPRVWTNIAAYAAIGTYLVYVLTGWLYAQFVA